MLHQQSEGPLFDLSACRGKLVCKIAWEKPHFGETDDFGTLVLYAKLIIVKP